MYKGIALMVGTLLLAGCTGGTPSMEAEGVDQATSNESVEQASGTDASSSTSGFAPVSFLDYKGKDEFLHARTKTEGMDLPSLEELEGQYDNLIDSQLLAVIQTYLDEQGIEDVSPKLVALYLDEAYRQGELEGGMKGTLENIVHRLHEQADVVSPLPEYILANEWRIYSEFQKYETANQVLKQYPDYEQWLERHDMPDIPVDVVVEYIDQYLDVHIGEQGDVLSKMNELIHDILDSDYSFEILLEHLQDAWNSQDVYELNELYKWEIDEDQFNYADVQMEFKFDEVVKIDPRLDRYYGIADITYSVDFDEEELRAYEERNGEPMESAINWNGGKDIPTRTEKTLVVLEKTVDNMYGFYVLGVSELDGVDKTDEKLMK